MIDAHAHLISNDTINYPPAPPGGTVNPADFENPMTVERLLSDMDGAGVTHAALVQRGSVYGFDSAYVCDSAARFPTRLSAVCSIDATQANCAEQVRYWVEDRGAAGIRFMELVKGVDISWLDSASGREGWALAAALGVPVCVHFFPWNRVEGLTRLSAIMTDIAGLTVVIDHFGAIQSDAGPPDHGVDEITSAIARFEGVTMKFTTIPLGRLDQAGIDAQPLLRRMVDLFGAERIMWGSDIAQSPGSYDYMTQLGRSSVGALSAAAQDQILFRTAKRIYGAKWA